MRRTWIAVIVAVVALVLGVGAAAAAVRVAGPQVLRQTASRRFQNGQPFPGPGQFGRRMMPWYGQNGPYNGRNGPMMPWYGQNGPYNGRNGLMMPWGRQYQGGQNQGGQNQVTPTPQPTLPGVQNNSNPIRPDSNGSTSSTGWINPGG